MDLTNKDANGIVLVQYNQDTSRGAKFQTTYGMTLVQTVGALSRTWASAFQLMTPDTTTSARTSGSNQVAFGSFGVFTLRTATAFTVAGAHSRCLRSNLTAFSAVLDVANGFGSSDVSYGTTDAGVTLDAVSNDATNSITSALKGAISNNNYLAAAEEIVVTATVVDNGVNAPTGSGSYPVIQIADTLSVFENIECNLLEGGSTTDYANNRYNLSLIHI